ncbi:McrC family protein [Halosquirtibacter xylanolyticus]|uniref:5-methylcytosine restriction system specificity protein McrC n=1 Tax=Halosquirtibacter xylanolyticus TaxID=3374599 RepID=UPI00374A8B07|nr:McrC family protein [Prolixibacteraceae bacterium]
MHNKIISCSEHDSLEIAYLIEEETPDFSYGDRCVLFPKTHRGKDASLSCFSTQYEDKSYQLKTSYFIGVDWLYQERKEAIQVHPKINDEEGEVDYLGIIFNSLSFPDAHHAVEELFWVKWDETPIEISQKEDLLTPLLIVEYLSILREIVRKGLKKSYYRVEKNLHSRIKGKVQVGATIKRNIMRQRPLHTQCCYEAFGVNNMENRLLKKAFLFAQRYLSQYIEMGQHKQLLSTIHYISPALTDVSDDVSLHELKHQKSNKFFKEYERGLKLAHFILKRFGYNIQETTPSSIKVTTPPFWIDMSKVFELHVLNLLRATLKEDVKFQFQAGQLSIDYLIHTEGFQIVVDAKYKPRYREQSIHIDDIRQVSGYARMEKLYRTFAIEDSSLIDCLIIYPDQENGLEHIALDDLKKHELKSYRGIYKLGVKMPKI